MAIQHLEDILWPQQPPTPPHFLPSQSPLFWSWEKAPPVREYLRIPGVPRSMIRERRPRFVVQGPTVFLSGSAGHQVLWSIKPWARLHDLEKCSAFTNLKMSKGHRQLLMKMNVAVKISGLGAAFSNAWGVQIMVIVSKSMKEKSNNPTGLFWKCCSVSEIKCKKHVKAVLWKQSHIIKPRLSISLFVLFWNIFLVCGKSTVHLSFRQR